MTTRTILMAAFTILLVGAIGAWVAYYTVTHPFPQTEGTLVVAGLSAPVTIRRNAEGVPLITTSTTEALFFAQGFVHAQDRLFQMDVQRRTAHGTLSALIGREGLPSDRLARSLELARNAEATFVWLQEDEPELITVLDAYSAGVNAFATSNELPVEYQWVGAEWERWQALDSVAIFTLYDYQVSGGTMSHWIDGFLVETVGQHNTSVLRGEKIIPVVGWKPVEPSDEISAIPSPYLPPSETWNLIPTDLDSHAGWFVPATQSSNQKPILASTLTLGLPTVPNPWYINALDSPTYRAVGASIAGVPLVISGYNDVHAWTWQGIPEARHAVFRWDGQRALVSHSFSKLEYDEQLIPVRGDAAEPFTRLYTDAGPILGEIGDDYSVYSGFSHTFDWMRVTLELNRESPISLEIEKPLWLPRLAWIYDKTEGLGFDYVPQHFDDIDTPIAVSEVISHLQMTTAPGAPRWVAALNRVPSDNIIIQRAQEQLAAWNGEMRPDLPGATLYRVVRAFTLQELLTDELGNDLAVAYLDETNGEFVDPLLDEPDHLLWDDIRTPEIESRDDMIARAWEQAHEYLGRRFGDVPHEWAWGRLHYATFRHPLADRFPILDRLLTRTVPLAGDASTLIPIPEAMTNDFKSLAIPSLRVVLFPGGDFYFAYPGGQSAHPFHPNANTFLEAWATGDLVKLEWNGENEAVLELRTTVDTTTVTTVIMSGRGGSTNSVGFTPM